MDQDQQYYDSRGGLYHKKSSSQLPPNLNNALKGQKHKTIQKQNMLRQMQRNQINTGNLIQSSQQRQKRSHYHLESPMSPKATAFQYPPNGYYQKNKLELHQQMIANSKLLTNLVNGVTQAPTAEIFKFEQELLAKNEASQSNSGLHYNTPQKKHNKSELYGPNTTKIKSTKFDGIQKSQESIATMPDDGLYLQGLIANAALNPSTTGHKRNSLSKNEIAYQVYSLQSPQQKVNEYQNRFSQTAAKKSAENYGKIVFPVIQLNNNQMQNQNDYNQNYYNLTQDSPGIFDKKKRVMQAPSSPSNRKSDILKTSLPQDSSTIQSKRVSDLKQEKTFSKQECDNLHKIQKLQISNAKNSSKQASQLTSLAPSMMQGSPSEQHQNNGQVSSEFSQYCDALNIKKNKQFIQNGGHVIKKSQIEFANDETARAISKTSAKRSQSKNQTIESAIPGQIFGEHYDNIHLRNFDYHHHQGISHSQSQELIKKQINSNGLLNIQKTQGGQDPKSLFQIDNRRIGQKQENPTQLALLCQFLAQTLQNEKQTAIPPQYHLDQNVIHQEILMKAAAAELYQNDGRATIDAMRVWQAMQKPQPTQIRFRNSMYQRPAALDNFTVDQLTQIKNLMARKDNNELIKQISSMIQTQEAYDQVTSVPAPSYTINQRIANQKQYDRQRMIDFYKAIKFEDINDQAKTRLQAIAQAPPADPLKLRFAVLPGNNSRLVKLAMQKRKMFWEETTNQDPHFHFRWTQVSSGIKFDSVGKEIDVEFHPCQKQLVNHYEGHSSLSEKSKLFLNMSRYSSEKLNENVFDYLPLTFFVECDLSKQKQYSKNMVQYMNAFYALDDIKKRTRRYFDKIDGIDEKEKVEPEEEGEQNGQLQVTTTAGEKDLLDDPYIFKHFYQNKIGLIKQHKREEREEREAYQEIYSRVQELPDQKQTQNKMLKKFFYRQSMPFCHYSGYNMWILKATKLNQGQGIHVCNTLPQIKTLIEKYCTGFPKKENDSFTMEKDIKAMQLQKQKSEQPRKAQLMKNKRPQRGYSENKIKLTPDDEVSSPERARSNCKVRTPNIKQIETINEEFSDEERQNSPQKKKVVPIIQEKQKDEIKPQVKEGEPKYKHNSFIIQKYIERPLLVKQRKFDIRIWVFINPQGEVYFCQKGYLRTSSYKFNIDPEDPDNRFVHLTNIAVQKYSEQFGQHEDGNILSTNQFQEYIDQTYPSKNYSIENDLMVTIKQQIARTLFASRKSMDPQKRAQNHYNGQFFELFGYDFMIDEDFNVWLIEVNTNPSLAESSQYLKELVPRMIDDLVKLTVDKEFYEYYCYIASQNSQDSKHVDKQLKDITSHKLKDFPDNKNIWEKFISLHNKQQRREDKKKYLNPIAINSQYAFQIKGREFKIKKYVQLKPSSKATPQQNPEPPKLENPNEELQLEINQES